MDLAASATYFAYQLGFLILCRLFDANFCHLKCLHRSICTQAIIPGADQYFLKIIVRWTSPPDQYFCRCQSESCIPVNNIPPREHCTPHSHQWMLYPIQYLLVNIVSHTRFTSKYCIPVCMYYAQLTLDVHFL